MKKFFVMLALAWGTVGAFAQNEADSVAAVNNAITLAKDVYPQKEEDGDLYHGLTRKLTFDRMIPPYGLEVTYGKTTHIIFPSSVRYVDLGSPNLIAGKADGAENVIRVKATVKDFREETNMSVITESGSFYTFNVKYAEEPLLLNIEMKDFIHDGSEVNRPNNALDIYLKELGCESPKLVHLISKSIHKDNRRHIKHIGCKAFGIQYLLRGLYTHNGLLYFHTQIKNRSNVPYEVDFVTFKIVDTYRHPGTGDIPTACLRLCNVRRGKKGRAHRFCLRQIHHPLGQGTGGGDARERRWQTPDLHRGK